MTIKTIERSLSREYNVFGLKEWKGARMVAEIDETEDEYECGKELERKVERQLAINSQGSEGRGEFVNALNLPQWSEHTAAIHPEKLPSIDYKEKERLEDLIEMANNDEELSHYKESADKYGLSKEYDNKLKKLTQ